MTATKKFSPPAADEYNEFFHRYISLVPPGDFLALFSQQTEVLQSLLGNLTTDVQLTLHEPFTWTLRQVMGHLIDGERIFSTRLLRIGVGDPAPLPGIDQNSYVAGLDYQTVEMQELLDEFGYLRNANVLLAKRMSAECLMRRGVASGFPVSAKANLFILAGHVEYHAAIIKKRLA